MEEEGNKKQERRRREEEECSLYVVLFKVVIIMPVRFGVSYSECIHYFLVFLSSLANSLKVVLKNNITLTYSGTINAYFIVLEFSSVLGIYLTCL